MSAEPGTQVGVMVMVVFTFERYSTTSKFYHAVDVDFAVMDQTLRAIAEWNDWSASDPDTTLEDVVSILDDDATLYATPVWDGKVAELDYEKDARIPFCEILAKFRMQQDNPEFLALHRATMAEFSMVNWGL